MVYGILKLLNFAHGDVFMVGAFIALGILTCWAAPSTRRFRQEPAACSSCSACSRLQ